MRKERQDKGNSNRIVLAAIGIGFLVWILESAVEYYMIFHESTFAAHLIPQNVHELWMRSAMVALAVSATILVIGLFRHRRMEAALQKSEESYRRNYILQKLIADVLEITGRTHPLEAQMGKILDIVLAAPLFDMESKGCIFVLDKKRNKLILEAQRGMPASLGIECSSIAIGQCLCGMAAEKREIIFAAHSDDRHTNHYEGMSPHSQYCIPILSAERVFGVLAFYVKAGHNRRIEDDSILLSIAGAIATVIERNESEIALRESESKFRTLFDQAHDSIFLFSPSHDDLIIEDLNEVACSIHGYKREELVGKSITLLDDRETTERLPGIISELMTGMPLQTEAVHIRKDASTFPVEISAQRIDIASKQYILEIDRDISDRKKALETLLLSRTALGTVLDGIESIVYVADISTYELLYMNKFGKNIFGDKEGEICWQVLQTGQSGPCDFCSNDKLLTADGHSAGVYQWEFQNTKNGQWYDIRDRAIQWVDGRIARLEIASDITELKKSEQELHERMKLAELNADIGIALTEGETMGKMLQGCTDSLVKHLDALFARIWTYDEVENVLNLRASSGQYTHLDGPHGRIPFGKFKIGTIAKERKAHLTNNVEEDPLVSDQEWVKRERIKAFAGHPLILENKLLGVLGLFSRNQLTELTLKALQSVANIISLGIEQKTAEERIIHAKEEWEHTFDIIPDLIAVIDRDYRVLRANKAMADILGIQRDKLIGKTCYRIFHGTDSPPDYCPHHECISSGKELVKEIYEENLNGHFILSANPVFDREGNVAGTVQVARNISARKVMEKKLEEAAITDDLTGLFNRRGFFTLGEQQCKVADRSGKLMSLLYLDLDGFKTINDELGHNAGDEALIDTANILRKTFRDADIIARLGGDEFVVLLTEPSGPNIGSIVKDHLQKNLDIHHEQAGRTYKLMISMGMSSYDPERKCSLSDLLHDADLLMYEDKKGHKLKKHIEPLLQEENIPRRVYKRFRTGNDCWAELDISGKVKIQNLSIGGACLQTPQPLVTDDIYNIKIIPWEHEEIVLSGIVAWSSSAVTADDRKGNLPYVAGLKFVEICDSVKSSLMKYTDTFSD